MREPCGARKRTRRSRQYQRRRCESCSAVRIANQTRPGDPRIGGSKMIGHLVGNYKVTDKIGEGGMGSVFRGIDIMLEREVAIKMLRPELSRQPHVVERFRSEAVTLA